jgi:hypothetical protein
MAVYRLWRRDLTAIVRCGRRPQWEWPQQRAPGRGDVPGSTVNACHCIETSCLSAGCSPEIGFSPISLHATFLSNGNTSPQSRDFLTTAWFGASIRVVFVQTPARFPRRTLRQRETRSVGRQKTRATERSRGHTARRIRHYRHCVPAIHVRRAFITIHLLYFRYHCRPRIPMPKVSVPKNNR